MKRKNALKNNNKQYLDLRNTNLPGGSSAMPCTRVCVCVCVCVCGTFLSEFWRLFIACKLWDLDQVVCFSLYVCLICMPYMYALYVCLICMPYMYALYVCLIYTKVVLDASAAEEDTCKELPCALWSRDVWLDF